MLALCETYRIRCVAIDRRGFGKSDWNGKGRLEVTDETFAKDTVHIMQEAQVGDFVFVGASMGCRESLLTYQDSEWARERCRVSDYAYH